MEEETGDLVFVHNGVTECSEKGGLIIEDQCSTINLQKA